MIDLQQVRTDLDNGAIVSRATWEKVLAAALAAESAAATDVLTERHRQVQAEGWTAEHDDAHAAGSLAEAAACYITGCTYWSPYDGNQRWPWALEWWKPKDRRRDLVRAAALLLAEIERLDRAAGA